MSSSQVNQTITGSEIITAGRDIINLHLATNPTAAKKPKIWKSFCTVPAPTPNFTGREDLISTIHRRIQQCSEETEYSNKIVVIHGLGGIGKSELVRKYVEIYRQNILNVAWIDAQSKNSLESSFKSLAEKLELPTKDREIKDVVSSIYEYLADHNQPSLFIFDNAEQMRSEGNVFGIFEFLPTVQQDNIPLIIITSRVNNWEIPEENILQINELSEEAGVKFFMQRWRLSSEQKQDKAIMDALKDLAQNLQYFPLGLTLAASNIKVSKLRSIPKEIKDYIKKLNVPHGGWIDERHSTGTASKYDLIMNNVWAATLEKIQAQGDDGEAAISVLNIIAYFPPDGISVEDIVRVTEFCGLLTSTAGIEMLELYSLISLPSSTLQFYQPIRIHRLVQLCTRDKLDREKNYNHLLKISMCLAHGKWGNSGSQIQTIHQHLKERMWPENLIQSSIIFPSKTFDYSLKYEIVKDVHEVLALDEKPGYVQNLADDYKILHALNLFCVSTINDEYKKLCKDLISKDPSYSKKYLEQVLVSSLGKCVKGLFMGTLDMEDLVNRAIIRVVIDIVEHGRYHLTLSAKVDEEISTILADATANSFEGSVETVGQLYRLLYCGYIKNGLSGRWYVETVLKIHGSVYARIKETGGSRLDNYWKGDAPIPYEDIVEALEDQSNASWNRRFQESFCTKAGLQFLLQHLQYLDALTQTKIDELPYNAKYLFELIMFLGWKCNCTKEFVQANLFMETLYSLTKNRFELNAEDILRDQFWCLTAWFGLFGKNTFVDRNGVSWSIQSVEKEMILFPDNPHSADRILEVYDLDWKAKAVLKKFIESSGSDQASIAVKTATQMLKYF